MYLKNFKFRQKIVQNIMTEVAASHVFETSDREEEEKRVE